MSFFSHVLCDCTMQVTFMRLRYSPPSVASSSIGFSGSRFQTQSTSNDSLFHKSPNWSASIERAATTPFKRPLRAKPNLLLTSLYVSTRPTSNGGWVDQSTISLSADGPDSSRAILMISHAQMNSALKNTLE